MLKQSATRQEGFTVIEVMIAFAVVFVALLAILDSTVSSGKLIYSNQREEQGVAYLQNQIELMRSIPFASLGLTSVALPGAGVSGNTANDPFPNNPSNPNAYATTCLDGNPGLAIKAAFRDSTGPTLACEDLVAGSTVNPGPDAASFNGVTGRVYRYVTAHAEGCVLGTICLGASGEKRITVAIVMDPPANGSAAPKPLWTTSIVADPNVAPLSLP